MPLYRFKSILTMGLITSQLFCGLTYAFVVNPSDSTIALNNKSLDQLIKDGHILKLESLVPLLPEEMRLNFVLKHGIKRVGERGHLIEQKVSQSSDPELPRAILWNESTGFTLSYNGGGEKQTANNRLDILSFSTKTKTFQLTAVDFPLTEDQIRDQQSSTIKTNTSCQECHGPNDRPIFSMYPDWPSFYGSDNDELNNPAAPHQKAELADFTNFKNQTLLNNPRYHSLFDPRLVEKAYAMPIWNTYPYRQDTSAEAKNISRSFSFRPGLRLGIVYNRQNADAVFKRMKDHKNYDQFALVTLHSLLQCDWNPKLPKTRTSMIERVQTELKSTPRLVGTNTLQLDYRQIWQLFGLKINDVDIRYSYNHEGYKNTDASKKIMEPGYIGRYFNAYFDGTATIDELIAAKLLTDLTPKYPSLKGLYELRGLAEKYQHLTARYHYDESLFKNYDRLGLWFAIPYSPVIFEKHHRETYTQMKEQHKNLCEKTAELMKAQLFN